MKNKPWLRRTLIQVAAFIVIVAVLDRLFFQKEFDPLKYVVAGLIYGAIMGYFNYRIQKKSTSETP